MLKQEAVFHWDQMANDSFQKIKDLIAKTASQPLRYYDRAKPIVVQADASQIVLGACLLQEGQLITFASKSLTDTETRYANIERELLAIVFTCQQFNTYVLGRPFTVVSDYKPLEMIHQKNLVSAPPRLQQMLLAIVFACQRFNTYVLGRPFTVESDHKPLEMIHQKILASAPPRLQQMFLQLQQYNVTIKYRPGKEMLLTDALSRCPSQALGEIKLDMRVNYIAFSKTWIAKLKDTMREDPILSTVYQLTQ